MSDIFVREATMEDVDDILRVDHKVWDDSQKTTAEIIEQRIDNYAQGVPVCIIDGNIVGYGSVILLDELESSFTWDEISGHGSLSTHTSGGGIMYGVSLTALPGISDGIGSEIFSYAFDLCKKENCGLFALGSRIPGFKKWKEANPNKDVYEYVSLEHKSQPRDRELRFYSNQGFKIGRVLPGYFPDPESLDNGVLVTIDV